MLRVLDVGLALPPVGDRRPQPSPWRSLRVWADFQKSKPCFPLLLSLMCFRELRFRGRASTVGAHGASDQVLHDIEGRAEKCGLRAFTVE